MSIEILTEKISFEFSERSSARWNNGGVVEYLHSTNTKPSRSIDEKFQIGELEKRKTLKTKKKSIPIELDIIFETIKHQMQIRQLVIFKKLI